MGLIPDLGRSAHAVGINPVCHNHWACTLEPRGCHCWSPCALEPALCTTRSQQWEACAPLLERSLCSPQLEESTCTNKDPAQPKKKKRNPVLKKKKLKLFLEVNVNHLWASSEGPCFVELQSRFLERLRSPLGCTFWEPVLPLQGPPCHLKYSVKWLYV